MSGDREILRLEPSMRVGGAQAPPPPPTYPAASGPSSHRPKGPALIVLAVIGLAVGVLGLGGAISVLEKPNVMVQIVAALWAIEGMLGLILLAVCLGARFVAKELRRRS